MTLKMSQQTWFGTAKYYRFIVWGILFINVHSSSTYIRTIMTRVFFYNPDIDNITVNNVTTLSLEHCAIRCLNDASCFSILFDKNSSISSCSILHDQLSVNAFKAKQYDQEYYVNIERICKQGGFTYLPFYNFCYLFDYSGRAHANTLKFCQDRRSILFRANTPKKQEILEEITKSGINTKFVYIDGRRITNGTWYFSNGKPIEHFYWAHEYPKETSNWNCLMTSYRFNHKWFNFKCGQYGETSRICEKEFF